MTVSEATTVQGKSIEDRVRDAGLPVLIGDEIKSKKVRKALYRDWKANFALYGEDNAVVMSYDIQLDESVKEAMQRHTVDLVMERWMSFSDIEQIIKTTNYDASRFLETSFSWYEDPIRINGVRADRAAEHESNSEYFKDIALKMETEFCGKTRRELEEKYGFKLMPVVTLDSEKRSMNPIGLKVTYQLAE